MNNRPTLNAKEIELDTPSIEIRKISDAPVFSISLAFKDSESNNTSKDVFAKIETHIPKEKPSLMAKLFGKNNNEDWILINPNLAMRFNQEKKLIEFKELQPDSLRLIPRLLVVDWTVLNASEKEPLSKLIDFSIHAAGMKAKP